MPKLFVCGDIVNRVDCADFISTPLRDVISNADYSICNFEGPEIRPGQIVRCPHQKPFTAKYLNECGFDLMLLANNHITELGLEGIKNTIETINATGSDCIGAGLSWEETYRPLIREIGNKRFGFINICEAQVGQFLSHNQEFGYAWMGYAGLFDDIKNLSSTTDYVVIFIHAGLEHYSIPLPQLRFFYKQICNAGASCVVGSHPHCAQGYEYYGKKLIIYSLGNFYFPRGNNDWLEENSSYSIILDFSADEISIFPIYHILKNNRVEKQSENETHIDLKKLCSVLNENYEMRAAEMCKAAYNSLCEPLLARSLCGECEDYGLVEAIKNAIRFTLFRKKYVKDTSLQRKKTLLRLFENESYRYTIINALKTKLSI